VNAERTADRPQRAFLAQLARSPGRIHVVLSGPPEPPALSIRPPHSGDQALAGSARQAKN
jgi:hypothetical protein